MRKLFFTVLALFNSFSTISQNIPSEDTYKRKPTFIVIPSDNLMNDYNFIANPYKRESEKHKKVLDYPKALAENKTFKTIISQIERTLFECDLPVKSLDQHIKNTEEEIKEQNVMQRLLSSHFVNERMMIAAFAYTRMKNDDKYDAADCIIKFHFTTTNTEFGSSIDITITAIDHFSKKSISTFSFVVEDNSQEAIDISLNSSIYEALIKRDFCNEISEYFINLHSLGREINLDIIMDNQGLYFDDLFSSDSLNIVEKDLSIIIDKWLVENSIDSSYTITSITPTQMKIESIRVSYLHKSTRLQTASYFAKPLCRFLRKYVKDDDAVPIGANYSFRTDNAIIPDRITNPSRRHAIINVTDKRLR